MITKDNTIGVVMGGPSREAEVSRKTGGAIAKALSGLGYHAVSIEYDPPHACRQLLDAGADAVFIALHGRFGEDGSIQGLLELMGIPYTGSGVTSSAMTMDKIMSKRLFSGEGIRMAFSKAYAEQDDRNTVQKEICRDFEFPVVLKPARQGSTIGIEIVHELGELPAALERIFRIDPRILVEQFLDGEEFTVSVLNGQVFPVTQICPHSGQYDYYSKYTSGATDYLTPAPIDAERANEMQQMALSAYRIAECAGVVRFDLRTDARGIPYLLEANSIPGMTETSLVPKAAAAAGIDFPHLCEQILMGASTGKV